MISRSCFTGAIGLALFIAILLHATRAEAGVCEDLAAARAAAANADPIQDLSDEVTRAKERVAAASVPLDATRSAAGRAAAEFAAANSLHQAAMEASRSLPQLEQRLRAVQAEISQSKEAPARQLFEAALAVEEGLWRAPGVTAVRVKIRSQESRVTRWFTESVFPLGRVEDMRRVGSDPTVVADLEALRATLGPHILERAESDIGQLEKLRAVDLKRALGGAEAALPTDKKQLLRRLRSGDLKNKLDQEPEIASLEAEQKSLAEQVQRANDTRALLRERNWVKQGASDKLSAAKRALGAAQREYDNAQAALQDAEARLSGSNTGGDPSGNPAENQVRMLEQQLEATFQGPLQAVASQALEALLQSTTKNECIERISRAAASYQQLKALAQAHAACLTPSIQQQILQVRSQARDVKSQCDTMPVETTRGDGEGGFESTGETTDVASETRAANVPADPGSAHVRSVQAAINSCNFDRALASLNLYRPADPNDPWMARKYQQIHEGRERVASVQRLLSQVRGILASNPSPDDIRYVAELMRTASSVAPNCMSTSISFLGPAVDGAAAAARQANRERTREAVAGLADALVAVQESIASRQRGGSDVASGPPPIGGIQSSSPANRSSGGGGFESSGRSSSSGRGVTVSGGTSAGANPPSARSVPSTPQGGSANCTWARQGILGQDAGTFDDSLSEALGDGEIRCFCDGTPAANNRCAGPKPR